MVEVSRPRPDVWPTPDASHRVLQRCRTRAKRLVYLSNPASDLCGLGVSHHHQPPPCACAATTAPRRPFTVRPMPDEPGPPGGRGGAYLREIIEDHRRVSVYSNLFVEVYSFWSVHSHLTSSLWCLLLWIFSSQHLTFVTFFKINVASWLFYYVFDYIFVFRFFFLQRLALKNVFKYTVFFM